MPFHRYRAFQPVDLPDRTWPEPDHAGPALALDRPARRQPGPDRPDDPARKPRCSSCWWDGLQGDRGRLPVGERRPTSTSCASSIEGDQIPDDVTISVLTQAREDLIERTVESLVGRHRADRPPLQRDRAAVPAGRLPGRQGRVHGDRDPRHRAGDEVRRAAPGRRGRASATSTAPRSSPAPSSTSRSRSARR